MSVVDKPPSVWYSVIKPELPSTVILSLMSHLMENTPPFSFLSQYCLREKTAPDSPPRVPSHSGRRFWLAAGATCKENGWKWTKRLSGPWPLHTGPFSLNTNPLPRRVIFMGPQRGRAARAESKGNWRRDTLQCQAPGGTEIIF